MYSFHCMFIIPVGHLASWSTSGQVDWEVNQKGVYLAQ